jgi:hypothetical protein
MINLIKSIIEMGFIEKLTLMGGALELIIILIISLLTISSGIALSIKAVKLPFELLFKKSDDHFIKMIKDLKNDNNFLNLEN